jgi:hypothetical protein
MTSEHKACTPGYEWMCATAKSHECHCACAGTNHGKFRHLMQQRAATGPWSALHARRVLNEAQQARRIREQSTAARPSI